MDEGYKIIPDFLVGSVIIVTGKADGNTLGATLAGTTGFIPYSLASAENSFSAFSFLEAVISDEARHTDNSLSKEYQSKIREVNIYA